jgi:hypothetical protein
VQKAPGEKASKANYMWMEKLSVPLWSPPDIDTPIKKLALPPQASSTSLFFQRSQLTEVFLPRPLHCVGPCPEIALRKHRFSLFLQHTELLNRAVKISECQKVLFTYIFLLFSIEYAYITKLNVIFLVVT